MEGDRAPRQRIDGRLKTNPNHSLRATPRFVTERAMDGAQQTPRLDVVTSPRRGQLTPTRPTAAMPGVPAVW